MEMSGKRRVVSGQLSVVSWQSVGDGGRERGREGDGETGRWREGERERVLSCQSVEWRVVVVT